MKGSEERSYWLKSGFFSLLDRGSVLVFGLGSYLILIRTLEKEQLGAWVLFLATMGFAEVAKSGLLQNALVKYLSTSTEEEYPVITTASVFLNFVISCISALILVAVGGMLSTLWSIPELPTMIGIYCITAFLNIPYYHCNFLLQSNLTFVGIFFSNFFKQGLIFFYILIFFLNGWDIEIINLAWMQAFTYLVASITSISFAWKFLRHARKIDFEWVGKLFHYGKFVFGTNVSGMLYKKMDVMMLGALINPVAVALYDLAVRIANMVEVPTYSVASVVFPQSARKMESGGPTAIRDLYEKSVGAILAMIIPFLIVIMIFTKPIIGLFSSDFLDAVPLLRLTILYGLFIPFSSQFGTVLDSIGKPRINFYFVFVGFGLNILLNYLFITNFGVVGAAYGTLSTYILMFIVTQIVLNRMFGVRAYKAFYYSIGFYSEGFHMVKNYFNNNSSFVEEEILDSENVK